MLWDRRLNQKILRIYPSLNESNLVVVVGVDVVVIVSFKIGGASRLVNDNSGSILIEMYRIEFFTQCVAHITFGLAFSAINATDYHRVEGL